jgi:TolB protein
VIAYLGKGRIHLINADGSDRRAIISRVFDGTFNWSPDAQQIAFTGARASPEEWEIRIASADGSNVRLLTRAPSNSAGDPTWSPDGKQIAFESWRERDERFYIYIIGADGKGLRRLTHPARGDDEFPSWSPDGNWVIFERLRYINGDDIDPVLSLMVIHPDGTGLHRIARLIGGSQCLCPDWSPDGTKIAYQAATSLATKKYPEIFVMNADGSGKTQLTRNRVRDENPDWSPDGKKIAFYSERRGNAEIYVIDADGRNVKRITRDPWYSSLPRWRPKVASNPPPPS